MAVLIYLNFAIEEMEKRKDYEGLLRILPKEYLK